MRRRECARSLILAAGALLAAGAGHAASLPAEVPHPPPSDNHYFDPADFAAEGAPLEAAPLWRAAGEPSLWIWSKHAELEGVTVIRLSLLPADTARGARFLRIMFPAEGGDGVLEARMLAELTGFRGGELADRTVEDFPEAQIANLTRVVEELGVTDEPLHCLDAQGNLPDAEGRDTVVFEMASHDDYFVTACPRSEHSPIARLVPVFSQFHRFAPARLE